MRAYYLGTYFEYKDMELVLIEPPVTCGAPAPGPPESMKEKRIQLSDLVDNPNSTYLWVAYGDSMNGARIKSGDILVIDKYLIPVPNDIIIAGVAGSDPMVKRLAFEDKKPILLPENPDFKPVKIDPEEGIKCMGVVTFGIYALRGSNALRRKMKAG